MNLNKCMVACSSSSGSSSSSNDTNKDSRLGSEATSSPLRAGRPADRDCSDRFQSPDNFKDVAEHGDFKNKRAAHYNEYKLGARPSVWTLQFVQSTQLSST